MFDDCETGTLPVKIPTGKKWWQFYKPKYTMIEAGTYTKIGNIVKIDLNIKNPFSNEYLSLTLPIEDKNESNRMQKTGV